MTQKTKQVIENAFIKIFDQNIEIIVHCGLHIFILSEPIIA